MKPEDCPKYERCNANICPMDAERHRRSHVRGEPVCLWLREFSKEGGEARIRERLPQDQAEAVKVAYLEITLPMLTTGAVSIGIGEVRRVLRQSAKKGSKLEAGSAAREYLR
jgi:hypothetical protein